MEKLPTTPFEPLRRFIFFCLFVCCFFFLLAITTYLFKQFRLNSIMNSCLGCQSSVRLSPQKRIGEILFGITVKLE